MCFVSFRYSVINHLLVGTVVETSSIVEGCLSQYFFQSIIIRINYNATLISDFFWQAYALDMYFFSSLLAAACEKKSLLLFDPLNGKLICAKNNAHSDCVNCVR